MSIKINYIIPFVRLRINTLQVDASHAQRLVSVVLDAAVSNTVRYNRLYHPKRAVYKLVLIVSRPKGNFVTNIFQDITFFTFDDLLSFHLSTKYAMRILLLRLSNYYYAIKYHTRRNADTVGTIQFHCRKKNDDIIRQCYVKPLKTTQTKTV